MEVASMNSRPHLMTYLPAIYQEADPAQPQKFLGQFLLAFESILLGVGREPDSSVHNDNGAAAKAAIEGLGDKIAGLYRIFDPATTPEKFLEWLAGWAALSLRPELSTARKRKLLAHIIPLYRIRGTREYIEQLLSLSLDAVVSVSDVESPVLQIARYSTVGRDTYIGGDPPFFFRVLLLGTGLNAAELEAQRRLTAAIVDLAKPAHTYYEIIVVSPNLQLGAQSSMGIDTVISRPSA
jgi:phage tail-like protein